jgi:hypothetical protein
MTRKERKMDPRHAHRCQFRFFHFQLGFNWPPKVSRRGVTPARAKVQQEKKLHFALGLLTPDFLFLQHGCGVVVGVSDIAMASPGVGLGQLSFVAFFRRAHPGREWCRFQWSFGPVWSLGAE